MFILSLGFLDCWFFGPLALLLWFIFDITELVSLISIGTGITGQTIQALSIRTGLLVFQGFVILGIVGLIVLIGVIFISCRHLVSRRKVLYIAWSLPFLGHFLINSLRQDSRLPDFGDGRIDEKSLRGILNGTYKATLHGKPKNLILLQLESFEMGALGYFNKKYPLSMPYLSSVVSKSVYFSNIKQQTHTSWSAAGFLVTQCGLPLMAGQKTWKQMLAEKFQRYFKDYENAMCIPTLLKQLGYRLMAFATGDSSIYELKRFRSAIGYDTKDQRELRMGSDIQLLTYISESILPELSRAENQPFGLVIITSNSHCPGLYRADCVDDLEKFQYPKMLRAHTCIDSTIKLFIEEIEALGLREKTELVIFGDHLAMCEDEAFRVDSEGNLTVIFPFHKMDERWMIGKSKDLTYYDFAPTILELLGVESSPPFFFGKSFFSKEPGRVPNRKECKFIQSYRGL